MIYRIANSNDVGEIIAMKNRVKNRIIEQKLPIWLNGYPLDEMIIDDIQCLEGRVIEMDNKIVAYSTFHHASKEYGTGVFKRDNVFLSL